MPHLAQLREHHKDELVAISLNVDYEGTDGKVPEETRKNVLSKLQELKIDCVNLIAKDGYDNMLDKYELAAIPAALIYDQSGKLHKKLAGEVDYAKDVAPLVAELLKKKK